MAKTPSTMLELGTISPSFDLPNYNKNHPAEHLDLKSFEDKKGLLVMFICNHCPFVKHIGTALSSFGRDYIHKGIGIVAINSNDIVNYPDDSPDKMTLEAETYAYPFPYLFDEDQTVAKAYKAACTPDFFLFNEKRQLVYRGQFDDARPSNAAPCNGKDMRAAADALLSDQPISDQQSPSIGCNIKWIGGQVPY